MSANPSIAGYTWNTNDVAREYSYSINYVRRLAQENKIPHIRVGRGTMKTDYRFNPDEVAEALRGRELQLACDSSKAEHDDEFDDLGV